MRFYQPGASRTWLQLVRRACFCASADAGSCTGRRYVLEPYVNEADPNFFRSDPCRRWTGHLHRDTFMFLVDLDMHGLVDKVSIDESGNVTFTRRLLGCIYGT